MKEGLMVQLCANTLFPWDISEENCLLEIIEL